MKSWDPSPIILLVVIAVMKLLNAYKLPAISTSRATARLDDAKNVFKTTLSAEKELTLRNAVDII